MIDCPQPIQHIRFVGYSPLLGSNNPSTWFAKSLFNCSDVPTNPGLQIPNIYTKSTLRKTNITMEHHHAMNWKTHTLSKAMFQFANC